MTQQIRLDDHVYEQIKANKRADESFSDAVERLIGGRSLREYSRCSPRELSMSRYVNPYQSKPRKPPSAYPLA